jgi:hypothetical protein
MYLFIIHDSYPKDVIQSIISIEFIKQVTLHLTLVSFSKIHQTKHCDFDFRFFSFEVVRVTLFQNDILAYIHFVTKI